MAPRHLRNLLTRLRDPVLAASRDLIYPPAVEMIKLCLLLLLLYAGVYAFVCTSNF